MRHMPKRWGVTPPYGSGSTSRQASRFLPRTGTGPTPGTSPRTTREDDATGGFGEFAARPKPGTESASDSTSPSRANNSPGQPRRQRSNPNVWTHAEWGPIGRDENARVLGVHEELEFVLHHVIFDRVEPNGRRIILKQPKERYL